MVRLKQCKTFNLTAEHRHSVTHVHLQGSTIVLPPIFNPTHLQTPKHQKHATLSPNPHSPKTPNTQTTLPPFPTPQFHKTYYPSNLPLTASPPLSFPTYSKQVLQQFTHIASVSVAPTPLPCSLSIDTFVVQNLLQTSQKC